MKTALEQAREIINGEINDDNRELAMKVEAIRKAYDEEGKEPEKFSWAALLAFAKKQNA